jgi:hypothetical protein
VSVKKALQRKPASVSPTGTATLDRLDDLILLKIELIKICASFSNRSPSISV